MSTPSPTQALPTATPAADPASRALTLFTAGSALDRATGWIALPEDERRRQAMAACRDHDADALWRLVDAWLTLHGRRGAAVAIYTRRNYHKALLALLAAWPQENLLRPRRDAGALWVAQMTAHGLAPATVTVHLAGARALYKALRWAGATEADPLADVRPPVDPTPAHEKRKPYSTAELTALLAIATPLERVILLLGAHGGLRAMEIVALTWADVDPAEARVQIREGKGGKQREVNISRSTVEALHILRAQPVGSSAQRATMGVYVLPFRSTKEIRVRMASLWSAPE